MLTKQAKILTDNQIQAVLAGLDDTRNPLRNKLMFLLSLHGFRAKEVASLEISMVTDAEGQIADAIALEDKASKGRSGRMVYMNKELKGTLTAYLAQPRLRQSKYVIVTERSDHFSPNAVAGFFKTVYGQLGFKGVSSHSGRRTFITRAARKILQAGGSLRDIQALSGIRNLSTVQRYIEQDVEAQRKVVDLVYA